MCAAGKVRVPANSEWQRCLGHGVGDGEGHTKARLAELVGDQHPKCEWIAFIRAIKVIGQCDIAAGNRGAGGVH